VAPDLVARDRLATRDRAALASGCQAWARQVEVELVRGGGMIKTSKSRAPSPPTAASVSDLKHLWGARSSTLR